MLSSVDTELKHNSTYDCKHTFEVDLYFVGMTPTVRRIFDVMDAAGIGKRQRRSTLAKVCGVSPQAIRDWEDGSTKNIRHDNLVAISEHFKISLHWLMTGKAETAVAANPSQLDARISALLQGLPEDRKQMILAMIEAAATSE